MKFVFLMWFIFALTPSGAFAVVSESDLQTRFSGPVQNEGPNCFNAAFMALGYLREVVHTSTYEAVFYLKNFCREVAIPPLQAGNGDLIVYVGADSVIYHMAFALGGGRVFEKYSYAGYHRSTRKDPSRPGEYFIQALQQSYYFPRYSPKTTKVFRCQESQRVYEKLAPLGVLAHVRALGQMTERLAADLLALPPAEVDLFFKRKAVSYFEQIKELLRTTRPQSPLEQSYVTALVSSLRDQFYFMAENLPQSCHNCSRRMARPVHENISEINHLLAKNYSQQFE